jgi:hypothetical protein
VVMSPGEASARCVGRSSNQQVFGEQHLYHASHYLGPSRAYQLGPLEVVTSDRNGNIRAIHPTTRHVTGAPLAFSDCLGARELARAWADQEPE